MKNKLIFCLLIALLSGCAAPSQPTETPQTEATDEPMTRTLPEKENPQSALMSDSPINAVNLDDYLLIEDVLYIDLRSPAQVSEEGIAAGFVNIPFYDVLVSYQWKENVLYHMTKVDDEQGNVIAHMGETGSFFPNYEESESLVRDLFPQDQAIVFMSTAGVEAAYMISLLQQLGYDGKLLYNAGTFSNGMGDIIAYKDYSEAKYLIPEPNVYTVTSQFSWNETLTPIQP